MVADLVTELDVGLVGMEGVVVVVGVITVNGVDVVVGVVIVVVGVVTGVVVVVSPPFPFPLPPVDGEHCEAPFALSEQVSPGGQQKSNPAGHGTSVGVEHPATVSTRQNVISYTASGIWKGDWHIGGGGKITKQVRSEGWTEITYRRTFHQLDSIPVYL